MQCVKGVIKYSKNCNKIISKQMINEGWCNESNQISTNFNKKLFKLHNVKYNNLFPEQNNKTFESQIHFNFFAHMGPMYITGTLIKWNFLNINFIPVGTKVQIQGPKDKKDYDLNNLEYYVTGNSWNRYSSEYYSGKYENENNKFIEFKNTMMGLQNLISDENNKKNFDVGSVFTGSLEPIYLQMYRTSYSDDNNVYCIIDTNGQIIGLSDEIGKKELEEYFN
jgi:hypothetical protein